MDWTDRQVALELLERLLHLGELDVELPQLRGRLARQVRAQQIVSLVPARLAQLVASDAEGEALRIDRLILGRHPDIHQPIASSGITFGRSELEQQLVAIELLPAQLVQPLDQLPQCA